MSMRVKFRGISKFDSINNSISRIVCNHTASLISIRAVITLKLNENDDIL